MIANAQSFDAEKKRFRSIWISDVHLGTRHAQVDALLAFLRDSECRYLYIVGDFIDGWQLRSKWHWQDSYNVLIQKLLRKSRKDTRIIYITGNHDEFLEQFLNVSFGAVVLAREAIHTAADGKRYLVCTAINSMASPTSTVSWTGWAPGSTIGFLISTSTSIASAAASGSDIGQWPPT